MESNFIFNLSGTMIKLETGETFELNEKCLVKTSLYKEEFQESLFNKSLFDENIVEKLLNGETLLNAICQTIDKNDVCIVDITNEDGFFDGKCQKISTDSFLKEYIVGDNETFVLDKKELMNVLGENYFCSETKDSFFIKEMNFEDYKQEDNYVQETNVELISEENNSFYNKGMTINLKNTNYNHENEQKNNDILNYTYEKAPVLETNEETDDILPLADNETNMKEICDDIMIKDNNNNDVIKAKDLQINKECFSANKKIIDKDSLLSK